MTNCIVLGLPRSGQMTVEEETFNQDDRTKEVTNDADDRAEEVATILPRSTRLFYLDLLNYFTAICSNNLPRSTRLFYHDLIDYFTTIYSTILPRSTRLFYHDLLDSFTTIYSTILPRSTRLFYHDLRECCEIYCFMFHVQLRHFYLSYNLILYLFNEDCQQPMATSGFPLI